MRLLICMIACALGGSGVEAAVYHVATTGNDASGDGTREKPWLRIEHALDACAPGDSVLVHAGIYSQRVEWNVSGSAEGGVITLTGEPGAILSGKGLKGMHLISVENQSYLRMENLELVDNENPKESGGIIVEGAGSHITISQCHIARCKGKNAIGIGIFGSDVKTPLSEIEIDGNTISDCEPAPSEALTLNGNVTKFRVTNNSVLRVNNIGIDFIGGEKDIIRDSSLVARDGLCQGNRVTQARSSYGGGYAAGIYVDGGRDIVIEGNVVTGCDLGIEVGAENAGVVTSGIVVCGNTIHQNDKAGIAIGGYDAKRGRVQQCQILSNQFYQNTTHSKAQAELWIQHSSRNEIRDNSFQVLPGKLMLLVDAAGKENEVDGNTWFSPKGAESMSYLWAGQRGEGFAALRQASGWEAAGKFAEWTLKLPAEITSQQP